MGFDFDFAKKCVQFLIFIIGAIALSFIVEKCRHDLVREEASSQSGKITFLNCFDMGSGLLACGVKEGAKLYFYNIQTAHVETVQREAFETALADAVTEGMSVNDAAKHAWKEGVKAAEVAKQHAKRIIGLIISSGWDFFEALYYSGTVTEGLLRGSGTLVGAYSGGFIGEQGLGRLGYLVGSHLGSWIGGRMGVMAYDVVVHFLPNFVHEKEDYVGNEAFLDSRVNKASIYVSFEGCEES
ncbi:uncharacterized protein LOC111450479 [Cucurbita moschata]|uniref:Uncharacterized protein LOC111450479 n=1 Tax=Cucurbita moschata TaxID=3662 RepID=A0A6J1G3T3_CUCMO|nr:uncharacterized protein LOC111450479 [Cucurbita moschata]